MSSDAISPIFYMLFGAFMLLVAIHLVRALQKRFTSLDQLGGEAKAFDVRALEKGTAQSEEWRRKLRQLTPREYEIAKLAAEGKSSPEIVNKLTISQNTVDTHLKHVFKKLDVHTRGELTEIFRNLVE